MPKITKTLVEKAAPKSKRFVEWDTEIKGFGLLVLPSGVKSFVFRYRNQYGQERRVTIGKVSPALTPDQARTKAKKYRRAVEDGRDPLGEKQDDRSALTIGDILERYLASARFAEKAESTQYVDRGRINRHLVPLLGKKIAKELTVEDVRRAISDIRNGKTACDVQTKSRGRARVSGGEGAARMAGRVFRAILNWAVDEGLIPTNPAASVKLGSDGNRTTILESPEQYKSLFQTLTRLETERRLRSAVCDAIRLIALTGCRRNEAASLRWSYVDLRAGLLILPPGAHKTGRATGQPKTIGLPAAAQAIIARQPAGEPDEFVFKPGKGDGPINLSKPWRLVRAEAGLPEGIGLHGLRHSLASAMAMQGMESGQIMTALGHRSITTSQKYVHWAKDERAKLAEKAAAHISAALTGSDEKPSLKVVK